MREERGVDEKHTFLYNERETYLSIRWWEGEAYIFTHKDKREPQTQFSSEDAAEVGRRWAQKGRSWVWW